MSNRQDKISKANYIKCFSPFPVIEFRLQDQQLALSKHNTLN